MSNIGFMENCTKHIEDFFAQCMKDSKKSPSKVDKEEYLNLIYQLELMEKCGEIEDKKKYKELLKRLKNSDLTRVSEIRKKNRKYNRI